MKQTVLFTTLRANFKFIQNIKVVTTVTACVSLKFAMSISLNH